jgi:hypothetical protein
LARETGFCPLDFKGQFEVFPFYPLMFFNHECQPVLSSYWARKLIGWALFSLFFLLLIGGCRSPQTRVEQHMGDLRVEWGTNFAHQAHLAVRMIDWPEAVALMEARNLTLRQSRLEITNSQEMVRQVFRDLTPTLNLRSGLNKRVRDIPNITADDVTFSVDSFFNIPGVVSLGSRYYVARLMLLRSETAYELTEREQTIELYKLFLAAQEVQEYAEQLERQKAIAQAMGEIDPFTGSLMLTEVETRELGSRHEAQNLQVRAGELLGDRSWKWFFRTNQLPRLEYDVAPLPLDDTHRVAALQMKLVALELEGARARVQGTKLRYWPELTLFVTGPPIYQRAGGQERFWDASEVMASANLFWYLDTRGYIGRQLRQMQRQNEIQRERFRQEGVSLINRLMFTQSILEDTIEKAQQIDFQMEVMEGAPPLQNYAALHRYADEHRMLMEQQRRIRRELAELQTLFWFVDEAAWQEPFYVNPLADAGK